jgi:hypothetical protein
MNKQQTSSNSQHQNCAKDHSCQGHDSSHTHGPNCGHPMENHGDHSDYVVNGHLHHVHNDHCDHHGKAKAA